MRFGISIIAQSDNKRNVIELEEIEQILNSLMESKTLQYEQFTYRNISEMDKEYLGY